MAPFPAQLSPPWAKLPPLWVWLPIRAAAFGTSGEIPFNFMRSHSQMLLKDTDTGVTSH